MEKLWKGRTGGQINAQANDFNASIAVDQRMVYEDIKGSIAHAAMLGVTGIIDAGSAEQIVAGLQQLQADIASGAVAIDPTSEDIHSFVETELTQRIGDAGKKLHTARSRNDQVALDTRMYLANGCDMVVEQLKEAIGAIAEAATQHAATIMPGYTHLQRAQPITFGHHLMAYAAMFLRDIERVRQAKARMLILPLGSGALAGTTYPIDRRKVCEALGFQDICFNSIDGVSDRDFVLDTAYAMSLIMAHLSRFCEEVILWCSWEYRFVTLSDDYSTGSSIMPQKKNPDIAELIRGKTGRVYGDLTTLLTMVKGLPLAYNKDLQEDKAAVFEAVDTVLACLPLFSGMLQTMTVHGDMMRKAASEGFINATDCADYLTKKGMPFRDAYRIVGELVAEAMEKGKTLETLTLDEYRAFSDQFEADIFEAINLDTCVRNRISEGGTAPESVLKQIAYVKEELQHV